MIDPVTIERLTEGYYIIQGETKIGVSTTDQMVIKIKALLGVTKKSTPRVEPQNHQPAKQSKHAIHAKPAVPAAKPGATKKLVHALLNDGLSTIEIAAKLGLSESAIYYHEKSYIPKYALTELPHEDNMDNSEDPDADFKPLVQKYQNTSTNYDGGKLDEVE